MLETMSNLLFRLMESTPDSEAIFADFYKISGLRGVYLASQLDVGVTEDNIRLNIYNNFNYVVDTKELHTCPQLFFTYLFLNFNLNTIL